MLITLWPKNLYTLLLCFKFQTCTELSEDPEAIYFLYKYNIIIFGI